MKTLLFAFLFALQAFAQGTSGNVDGHETLDYAVQSDRYTFAIPEGYVDATSIYKKASEDPRLVYSLACVFVPKENMPEILGGQQIAHPEVLKIDILKASKDQKISAQEFQKMLNDVRKNLPKITSRNYPSRRVAEKVADDQIKKTHGNSSGSSTKSTENQGIIYEDERSLLWTQTTEYDSVLYGEKRTLSMIAVHGAFYLDGRCFYLSLTKEFGTDLDVQAFESIAIGYVQNIIR